MDLFGNDPTVNLLPCDGTVNYFGRILDPDEARRYYEALLQTIPWKNDEAIIFGKHIVTARKVAWYGDADYSYTYSGTTKQALVWTKELLALKAIVEKLTAAKFNSCLLNLYHDGNEGMAWHSDDETFAGQELDHRLAESGRGTEVLLQAQANAADRFRRPGDRQSAGHEGRHPDLLATLPAEVEADQNSANQPHLPHHGCPVSQGWQFGSGKIVLGRRS